MHQGFGYSRQVIWALLRSRGRTEAKSYPQLVLGHKSVNFEKEADAVSHVSELRGTIVSFTAFYSRKVFPTHSKQSLTLSFFSTCD